MICIIVSVMGLIICSVTDIKTKRIYILPCLLMIIFGTAVNVRDEWQNYIAGIGIGLLLFLFSITTKQAIGYGDALTILSLGCLIRSADIFHIVFLAFVLVIICGIIGGIRKKISLKSELPFVPFLLISEIIILLNGGIQF